MSPIRVRAILPDEVGPARLLLAANGWTGKVEDPPRFQDLVRRSQIALVALEGDNFWKSAQSAPKWKGFVATTQCGAIEAFNRLTGDNVYLLEKRRSAAKRSSRTLKPNVVWRRSSFGARCTWGGDVDDPLEDGDINGLLELLC